MNIEKYLPIGTVVLLKNAQKRVMIIGFAIQSETGAGEVYDYLGCLYPEGIISSNQNLVFNHDQIDKVFYIGYQDDEWKQLEQKIDGIIQEMRNI